MSIRHLQKLNDNAQIEEGKANIFYQKVNFSNVGIVGHSQGGIGVFNAITAQAHRDVYKVAVSLFPTNKELAHVLEWDYDAALVNIPSGVNIWCSKSPATNGLCAVIPSVTITLQSLKQEYAMLQPENKRR